MLLLKSNSLYAYVVQNRINLLKFKLKTKIIFPMFLHFPHYEISSLKVVTSEKIGGSGVTTTLGTWYGGVVMGVLLFFNEATILYRDFNSAPSQKQNIIVFEANNSRCCEFYVAPTIIL
jgi:hypothetical protein